MSSPEISSPSNERIKRLVRLKDRRQRDREGVFVVEGQRLLERAIAAGHAPIEIYVDPNQIAPTEGWITVAAEAMDKASYRQNSEGVIAVFKQFTNELAAIKVERGALVLVVEGIEKPGNLGAMLRTADAVGAHALIAVEPEVDLFNPNVLRTSTGAAFTVPFASASLDQLGVWLSENSIPLVVASPESAHYLWDVDLSGTIAIAIGSEADGITPDLDSMSTAKVSIPMEGAADSLNASVAMAVIAFEAKRQRDGAQRLSR